jgi:hypothetical protein
MKKNEIPKYEDVSQKVELTLERYEDLIEKEKKLLFLRKAYEKENSQKVVIAKDMLYEINNLLSYQRMMFRWVDDKVDYSQPMKVFAGRSFNIKEGREEFVAGLFNVEDEKNAYQFVNRVLV